MDKITWSFTDEEKGIVRSIVAKGDAAAARCDDFAIIDFDSYFKLFNDQELSLIQKFCAIKPEELDYALPFLGYTDAHIDLVSIPEQSYIKNGNSVRISAQYLPRAVYDAYQILCEAMERDIGIHPLVSFGYRSPARQVQLFFDMLLNYHDFDFSATLRRVCFPEYSEHVCSQRQAVDFITREGVDVDFDRTKEYAWLKGNAQEYGFFESYPKDNNLNMMFEPWHWHFEKPS
ncbi:D-alanyl-D-alanine carboxypeptidase family protein [Candidatus Kaiserbacteria bacterium]|nr:D-alanyl-D-alanine carboxypeptidase family protein [Candidatus Kaiserbacteria bacterium]